jgi:hypothetical protein
MPAAAKLRDDQRRWAGWTLRQLDGWSEAALSAGQSAELTAIVETDPDRKVDGVVRWRRVDLKRVIAQRFGVDYGPMSASFSRSEVAFLTSAPGLATLPRTSGSSKHLKNGLGSAARLWGGNGLRYREREWSGRKVFGGPDPVKKPGPWAVATCEW